MSFRGGRNRGGGPPRSSRGRFRGRSRERSLSRERARHRNARSRSRERRLSRERFVSPPRRNRGERGRSFERFRSPPRDHAFEENFLPPRFEYPNLEVAPIENFDRIDRERGHDIEIIEDRRGSPGWRGATPRTRFSPARREVEFSRGASQERQDHYPLNVFEGKEDDKQDPWVNNSGVIPTFGQEKSSSLIPEFNPDNAQLTSRAFLKHVERVAVEQKWNNEDKKFHFSTKLIGTAKEWFITGNKILDPWVQIRKSFLRAFPSEMEYYSLLETMMKRTKTPDEDLSTYFNYKMVLINNCKITGRRAVSCLIGGLSELVQNVKEEALEHNFPTPEDLYNFLKDKDVDNSKKTFQKVNPTSKKKCYRCNDYGHVSYECPKGKEMGEKPSKPSAKEEKQPKYKDVQLFGWLTKAIFDDSHPHITVRESDMENFEVKYKRQVSIIDGSNGMKLTSLGQAVVHLKVDLLSSDVNVHVVKDQTQTVPIILGKAMRKYAHYIEDRKGVHFSPLEKGAGEGNRKESRAARSPNRHGPSSQGNFKDSHPFLSKFYGK
nr:uncharacterized protein LOC111422085 [Onthophagus taurus]